MNIVQELVGCAWGRKVGLPNDDEPCYEKAVQIVVVHDGRAEIELKLCAKHRDVVLRQTTPHV